MKLVPRPGRSFAALLGFLVVGGCGVFSGSEVGPGVLVIVVDGLRADRLSCMGYDRPTTLFYIDPPYYGCEGDYGIGLFERADFERLASALKGLRGRFILSLNDVPENRRIFAGFELEPVRTTYTIGAKGNGKCVGELLISGGG